MRATHGDVGSVSIECGKLRFASGDYGNWEVSLDDVALLGEYTTQDGPMIEDHYFVVVSKCGEEFELPVTASGADEMQQTICRMLDVETVPRLTLNADFASRIMAPRSLQEQPLFVFEVQRKSFLQKLFSGGRMNRCLSQNAKSVLQSRP
jgi:hypothetical protein